MRRQLENIKMRLMGRSRRFAAVDFDSRRLRVALCELVGDGVRITGAISQPVPDGLDVNDGGAFGELLGETLRGMGFRGAGVVMSVPRSQAVLKPLSLPAGTPEQELPGMVSYQVEKDLPFSAEDAVIDFAVEGPHGAETEQGAEPAGAPDVGVLVAAVRVSVVDYYRRIAVAAGVRLLRLGLRSYADLHCLKACEGQDGQEGLAVVHVTSDETEIDLLSRGRLAFSRSAVKDIGAAAGPGGEQKAETVNWLVMEVARSLQSYLAVERGAGIEAVFVAGETGLESGVAEGLTGRLSVPCRMLQVADAFETPREVRIGSAFVSTLGLAIAQSSAGELTVDFLNPKRPPVARDMRKVRVAAIAAGVAVLVLAGGVGRAFYLGAKEDRLKALLTEEKELTKEIATLSKTAKQVAAIEDWVNAGHNWLDQWAYLSCLFPSAQDVYLTGLQTRADGTISFTVQARNIETIASLGERLNQAGYNFKPGTVRTASDPYNYLYSTTVEKLAASGTKIDLATTQPATRPADDSSPEDLARQPAEKQAPPTPAPPARPPSPPVSPPEVSKPAPPGSVRPSATTKPILPRPRPERFRPGEPGRPTP